MGCLARDFLPGSITFSWKYENLSAINNQDIKTFPSVLREGKYVATSQVFLPSVDIIQGSDEYITCNVKHSNGDKSVNVPITGESRALLPVAGWAGWASQLDALSPHSRACTNVSQRDCLHPTPRRLLWQWPAQVPAHLPGCRFQPQADFRVLVP